MAYADILRDSLAWPSDAVWTFNTAAMALTVVAILGRNRDVTGSTSHTTERFAEFFKKKIDDIRSATAGIPPPEVCSRAMSSLAAFQPFAEADVRRIIMSSPIKSCSLDPVPTFLLREFVDLLLPDVTRMVNASLEEGRLPISQRHAIVTPLLKKPGLDTADMSNYRPVSNLGFMSKVVERAVAIRLNDYLTRNSGGATLWQSSANALPVCSYALPVALPVF